MSEFEIPYEKLSEKEIEVVESASRSKQRSLVRQILASHARDKQSVEEKADAEVEYRKSTGQPGLVAIATINKKVRIGAKKQPFSVDWQEEREEAIFIPYQANMGQPNYANRMQQKGIRPYAFVREEVIVADLLDREKTQDPAQFGSNVTAFRTMLEQTKVLKAKDGRIAELEAKLAEAESKLAVVPANQQRRGAQ